MKGFTARHPEVPLELAARTLVLMNASHERVTYVLPDVDWRQEWEVLVDTAGELEEKREHVAARGSVPLEERSLVILSRPADR